MQNFEINKEESSKTSQNLPSGSFVFPNANVVKLQGLASKDDPSAQELLVLMQARQELEKRFIDLEGHTDGLKKRIENYQSDLQKVNNFIIGIVVAVSIAFVVTTLTLYWNQILATKADRELYLKYNDIYKNYYDSVYQQQKQIDQLNSNLELLKAKNSYLK
ncbi:hypothetical protein A3I27_00720 [Candidatus Giovannonibacteria bacterium RIFCSPLOWO2_02_FULL_43_11b]|uniref:Uncharacterized protein n=1 Tax=Candidatus Giovannonibacteria bacterium RIFCSPHIGHO2_12_FULL_43_15 TaxID=1798341 RepID=A0A1F5WPN9_9BACT|nr:MAG: hypothetical protein A3B97_01410 [Candidatus Giovannonibacteria bacterium RIFCSPHIGHO2_02_FULL_43_32]OGF77590.1 MAG: hypothetical protein A3F23_00090 [Candidatus Giovannonibacteria bacterium RIFCSPHIGHO2_12_FULL_43_15]OGF90177.1 MAG: hypothetical protein A3I27_00720 [Candidatus Giovannonibacteria bacterium RIFCSPLOWO2_02_FULL_43_11b]OGF92563.1 MAG: hypothetical protein A3H04_01930 [Candidatus Giovannonibacteria bacterium RIFCSPLOWO2_12_FULL_43_11c]